MDTLMQAAVSSKQLRELVWTAFLCHYVKDKYHSGIEKQDIKQINNQASLQEDKDSLKCLCSKYNS